MDSDLYGGIDSIVDLDRRLLLGGGSLCGLHCRDGPGGDGREEGES